MLASWINGSAAQQAFLDQYRKWRAPWADLWKNDPSTRKRPDWCIWDIGKLSWGSDDTNLRALFERLGAGKSEDYWDYARTAHDIFWTFKQERKALGMKLGYEK